MSALQTLLWLSSPALPVGAFAWSQGLEQCVERGLVSDLKSLEAHLEGVIREGLAYWDLPLLKRLYDAAVSEDAEAFAHWDCMALAGRETKELCEEEQALGAAFSRLLRSLELFPKWLENSPRESFGYLAMFALAGAQSLERGPHAAAELLEAYAFSWAQNQVSVAVKAVPLGQTDGQRALRAAGAAISEAVAQALSLEDEDLGTSLPGLALMSALHERQYSRLFRS